MPWRPTASVRLPRLEGARAALARAEVDLGYTRIVAPFDGMTTARQERRGDYVAPGTALISLVPLRGAWAVANYREVQVTRMRPGQPARVFVDAIPGVVFSGHVDSLEPDTQAEGSLLPPDRATGSFTKIEQRVPVKVVLDARPAFDARLLPGLSAEVEIDTAGTP
jgi:membrane fusion protein (multidrug efflux system)